MLWSDMLRFLGERPIKILSQADPRLELDALRVSEQEPLTAAEGLLLCCRYRELPAVQWPEAAHCGLLLLLEEESVDAALWQRFDNVAAVSDRQVYQACIAAIRGFLREYRRMERAQHRLMEQIAQNRSLAELADEIAHIYDHYTDILDNSLNILAISESMAPPVENLLQDHKHRYVKPNVVQYLRTSGSLAKMQRSRLPVLVEDEPRGTYAYSAAIGAGSLNLGFLCVFLSPGERLTPVQLHFLPDTARLLSLEMQKSRSDLLNKSTYFTRLLSDMLQGRSMADSSFESRFLAFDHELRHWKNLIVLHLGPTLPPTTDLHVLSRTLQALFGNCVYMVQDSYLVFLTSRRRSPDIPAEQLTEWRAYMSANHLRVGISDSFENPLLAGACLEQAKAALTLGERFRGGAYLHLYDELRLLDVVDKLSGSGDLRLLCFPPLLRLMEADTDHNLVHTLRCYMNSGFSAAETCQALFIHRNTLYYRLGHIRQLMGCDFARPEIAAQITLTFAILQYLGQPVA